MRLHQVTSRLFTGPRMDHDQALWTNEIGITHWANVAKEHTPAATLTNNGPRYTKMGVYDQEKHITDEWISSIINEGLLVLSLPGTKLLITCLQGENRSPTAAYAVLRAFGLDQMTAKRLSVHQTAPKYAHIVDRYVDRTLNLG